MRRFNIGIITNFKFHRSCPWHDKCFPHDELHEHIYPSVPQGNAKFPAAVVAKERSLPTYEQLELMYIEADARQLHAKFSYPMLDRQGTKSKAWDELSEEKRESYREEAKERLV